MEEKLERKLRSTADLIERADELADRELHAEVASVLGEAIKHAEDVQLAQQRRAEEPRRHGVPDEDHPDVDECIEQVESDIGKWTDRSRRVLQFHVGLVEFSSEPLTLTNLLKALVDHRGFRRGLVQESPSDSGVRRYFNRDFRGVNPVLVRGIAWKVAGFIESWFYRRGVLERVEHPDLEENREGLKRRYQEFKELKEHIEEFRR